ncbi:2-dehydro-3-deoxyphosphogalactonate aldolase [Erwinia toletana]|uniref:2-dehydro-3-deoxyphosphogalactonate aldolase n=1 Tax=Winslowiella toletana TaxID=92490 RepID=A0ABS4P6T7_9GAMM|nr:hypothetical protein [Winslowiella toletana]MBP2168359.1 2-dehydro-3-deoxyphosphogalactonate aldolase [Winslowiella toletana]
MMFNGPVVAILRGITPHECLSQVECLLQYGITDIEIPANSPDWQTTIRLLKQQFGSSVHLGAGTITEPQLAEASARAGADYILTPNLNPAVIRHAQTSGLKICAGVFSASEIFSACALRADALKIFPAAALPVDYPQLIKGPLQQPIPFCAVGGINLQNIAAYLSHYDGVGIGSALYQPGQSLEQMHTRCRQLIAQL